MKSTTTATFGSVLCAGERGTADHGWFKANFTFCFAGDLQHVSPGSGVTHSEFNPSDENPTTLYQIWLQSKPPGGEPCYAEKPLADGTREDALTLLFSGDGIDGSTEIRQNAEIYCGKAEAGTLLEAPASETIPNAWLQVIEGELEVLYYGWRSINFSLSSNKQTP